MERREFLRSAVFSGVAAQSGLATARAIPRRRYRDEVELLILGFGGMLNAGLEQAAVNRLVAESFERGVNYFDVAPKYGNAGEAEIKLRCGIEARTASAYSWPARRRSGARPERDPSWRDRSIRRLRMARAAR